MNLLKFLLVIEYIFIGAPLIVMLLSILRKKADAESQKVRSITLIFVGALVLFFLRLAVASTLSRYYGIDFSDSVPTLITVIINGIVGVSLWWALIQYRKI